MSSKNLNQSLPMKGIGTTKHGHKRTAAGFAQVGQTEKQ
jgi:hypothetical protein